jgi:hypothetical protein
VLGSLPLCSPSLPMTVVVLGALHHARSSALSLSRRQPQPLLHRHVWGSSWRTCDGAMSSIPHARRFIRVASTLPECFNTAQRPKNHPVLGRIRWPIPPLSLPSAWIRSCGLIPLYIKRWRRRIDPGGAQTGGAPCGRACGQPPLCGAPGTGAHRRRGRRAGRTYCWRAVVGALG